MVSIIMTVYNDEKYVSETINSILKQSYKNFEFLIYDDASTDDSLKLIKKFEALDKRIKVFSGKKLGRAKALNFLVNNSKGRFIANIDSDDPSLKERISRQVEFLYKNPHIVLVGTGTELIDNDGKKIGEIYPEKTFNKIKNQMAYSNPFIHSSVMIRKDKLIEVGSYNENLFAFIDYELWIRLLKKYKASNLQETLIQKRIHQGQYFESSLIPRRYTELTKYYFLAIKKLELSKKYYFLLWLRIFYYHLPKRVKKAIKNLIKKLGLKGI